MIKRIVRSTPLKHRRELKLALQFIFQKKITFKESFLALEKIVHDKDVIILGAGPVAQPILLAYEKPNYIFFLSNAAFLNTNDTRKNILFIWQHTQKVSPQIWELAQKTKFKSIVSNKITDEINNVIPLNVEKDTYTLKKVLGTLSYWSCYIEFIFLILIRKSPTRECPWPSTGLYTILCSLRVNKKPHKILGITSYKASTYTDASGTPVEFKHSAIDRIIYRKLLKKIK